MFSSSSSSSSSSSIITSLFHVITYGDIQDIMNKYKNKSYFEKQEIYYVNSNSYHNLDDRHSNRFYKKYTHNDIKTIDDFLKTIPNTKLTDFVSIENLFKLVSIFIEILDFHGDNKNYRVGKRSVIDYINSLITLFEKSKIYMLHSMHSISKLDLSTFIAIYSLPSEEADALCNSISAFNFTLGNQLDSDQYQDYLAIYLKNPTIAKNIWQFMDTYRTDFTPTEMKQLCTVHREGFIKFVNDLQKVHALNKKPTGYHDAILREPMFGVSVLKALNWLDFKGINTENNRKAVLSEANDIHMLEHLAGYDLASHRYPSTAPDIALQRIAQRLFDSVISSIKSEKKVAFLMGIGEEKISSGDFLVRLDQLVMKGYPIWNY